jgi:hypothetical protein
MGDQNSALIRRQLEHRGISQASKPGSLCGLEIDAGFQAERSSDDDLIQIGVSLKTHAHADASCRSRRAFAICCAKSESCVAC